MVCDKVGRSICALGIASIPVKKPFKVRCESSLFMQEKPLASPNETNPATNVNLNSEFYEPENVFDPDRYGAFAVTARYWILRNIKRRV